MAKTKISGLNDFTKKLLSSKILYNDKDAKAAVLVASNVIVKEARRLAPRSSRPHQLGVRKHEIAQPGNLQKNIVSKYEKKTALSAEMHVGFRAGSARVPTDAFYGRFFELGTVKLSPQPMLAPALRNKQQEAQDAMARRLARKFK